MEYGFERWIDNRWQINLLVGNLMNSSETVPQKFKTSQIIFVFLSFTLTLSVLAMYVFGGNLIQYRNTLTHHGNIFLHENLIIIATVISIMMLCLLNKFQRLDYQRYLLLFLVISLIVVPSSKESYPITIGFPRAISNLVQAWIQLYVPPSIRASTSGLLSSLAGAIEVRSVQMESYWSFYLNLKRYYSIFILLLLVLFWKYTIVMEKENYRINTTHTPPINIFELILKYPYILVSCLAYGFNYNILSYGEFLAKAALPSENPKTYQYIIYLGATFFPLIAGRLGDKFGVSKCIIYFLLITMGFKFLTIALILSHMPTISSFYILIFIEAGLAGSLWALNPPLIGEIIDRNNLFRTFSLATLFCFFGAFLDGYIYRIFPLSIVSIKSSELCVNSLLVLLFWYLTKKKIR